MSEENTETTAAEAAAAAEETTAPEAAAVVEEAAAAEETPESEVIATPSSVDELERKMKLKGTVERLELYGAFIDIGLESNALVHISKIQKGHVNRVSDVLNVGDEVEVWVDNVDADQIMVTMVEPVAVEWRDLEKGQVYTGEVTRLESFGAFVDIGAEREGLVHISELSHDYVNHPSEVVNVGDEAEVQVLGFNRRKRRIDLSMKALLDAPESTTPAAEDYDDFEEEDEELPTAMEIAMRRAMGKTKSDNGKQTKKNRKKKRGQDDILSRTLKLGD